MWFVGWMLKRLVSARRRDGRVVCHDMDAVCHNMDAVCAESVPPPTPRSDALSATYAIAPAAACLESEATVPPPAPRSDLLAAAYASALRDFTPPGLVVVTAAGVQTSMPDFSCDLAFFEHKDLWLLNALVAAARPWATSPGPHPALDLATLRVTLELAKGAPVFGAAANWHVATFFQDHLEYAPGEDTAVAELAQLFDDARVSRYGWPGTFEDAVRFMCLTVRDGRVLGVAIKRKHSGPGKRARTEL